MCNIRAPCKARGKKILLSSVLNAESIKYTLRLVAQEIPFSGEISREKGVINLGAIPASQFDTLFTERLAQAFADYLAREQASAHAQPATGRLEPESADVLNERDHDGENLYQLALDCLQPAVLQQRLRDTPAARLQQWLRLLLLHTRQQQEMLPTSWYSRVTASRLSMAAVWYLQNSQQGRVWLSQHAPAVSQVTAWGDAIAQGEIPSGQVVQLLTGGRFSGSMPLAQPALPPLVATRWLLPLWQQNAVRHAIRRQEGAEREQQIAVYLNRCLQPLGKHARPGDEMSHIRQQDEYAASPGQHISNAGLLLLWPLLPQLFAQLALCEEQQFISDGARWQALYCLNWLVWSNRDSDDERLTLNQLLCGISLAAPLPTSTNLSEPQQQQIDRWLTAIGQQLPGWQTLSLTDIRQLFLQRTGEISTEGALPQIIVRSEPYDYLLRDWPWPMTLASFPWTEQPLTIVWPTLNT
ncbi:contractile injection system tape measure protein [Serratia sp. NPDC078593]